MEIFKRMMYNCNKTLTMMFFGMAITNTFLKNYILAIVLLFIVSIMFIVGYFAETWSD